MQWKVRVDLNLNRPVTDDISVWVLVEADDEMSAWRQAIDIAISMPARNGMATANGAGTTKPKLPVMAVGTYIESVVI